MFKTKLNFFACNITPQCNAWMYECCFQPVPYVSTASWQMNWLTINRLTTTIASVDFISTFSFHCNFLRHFALPLKIAIGFRVQSSLSSDSITLSIMVGGWLQQKNRKYLVSISLLLYWEFPKQSSSRPGGNEDMSQNFKQ